MKNSMAEWKEYKLGDVLSIKYGKDHKHLANGDIPIYGSGGIMRYGEKSLYDGPSILIPRKGSLNNIMYSEKPFWTVDTMFWTIINEKIANPLFVYYSICKKDFASLNVGSAVPSLTVPVIEDVDILLPAKNVQDEVVSVLKSLDDKIEVNKRINRNLEEQAQALFKSWFVDFEPFKDGEFVDSELGMIPKGWRVGTFLDIINVMPGGTPSTSTDAYWKNGDIPFFSPKDVCGVYCFDTEKYITELGLNNCSSHLYPKDTLFITARGTVGKLTLAGVPMAMNQSNYALVAKEGIGLHYLFLLAQTIVAALLKKANGAVFSAITTRDFNEPTIIPEKTCINSFENLVSSMFEKIHSVSVESSRLASLRDTLLPRLMSGELKVNEINI